MADRKILHSITGLNVGGAELMLSRFLGKTDRSRCIHEVLSLMPGGPVADQIAAMGVSVTTLGMDESKVRPSDFWLLRKKIATSCPSLVHGWMYHGNAAALFGVLASLRSTPVIWSIHHSVDDLATEKPLTQRIIKVLARLSRWTAAISYCSRVSADQHESLGFDSTKRRVIPNGIDCSRFQPAEEGRQSLVRLLNIPEGRKIIGNVARFHPMKDQASLVRATARLLESGLNVQCVFVGAGHDEHGPVQKTARELNISDRISTLGLRGDLQHLLPGLDVYALPSAWGEAFPLAVAEAMACGVPAVATDVGDCAWLIGETGRIVAPRDTEALAKALTELLSLSPDARRKLGEQARLRVVNNFSLEQYVAEHECLYREVLEGRAKKAS